MRTVLSITLTATFLMGSTALAQDQSPDWAMQDIDDREAKLCISIPHIDRTNVLDDNTIIFYMRGRTHYVNKMANRCPSLYFEDRFTYSTTLTQLCNTDTITVLRPGGSTGFIPGPTCGLDEFTPITRDEGKMLKEQAVETRKAEREARKAKKGD